MTNSENNEQDAKTHEIKKISLADAVKQKLASKKQGQSNGGFLANSVKTNPNMKSQQTKKRNNQRRRTGV
jgi:hypothetical protein